MKYNIQYIIYFLKAYPLTIRPVSLYNKSSQASAVFTVVVVLEKDLMLKCVPAMLFLSNGCSSWFGKHMGRMMLVKCPSSFTVGSSILLCSCNKATLYTDSGIKPWLGSVWYFGWISIRLIFIQSGARANTLDDGYYCWMLNKVHTTICLI